MKKILFVTYNNPEKKDIGDKRYTWDILTALKHKNKAYVHVVCYFEEAKENMDDYSELEKLVDKVTYVPFIYKNIIRIGFSVYPAMIANRKTREMIVAVRKLLTEETFDDVMVNMFRMAYIVESIRDFNVRKIFISHNVEFLTSQSIYQYAGNIAVKIAYMADYLKTRYWEKRYLKQYDSVSAICSTDVETYRREAFNDNVFLLRTVVDMNDYEPKSIERKKMIACGNFTWTPKRMNLSRLLDARNISDIPKNGFQLMIIGRSCQSEINKGNKIDGVYVSGEVPSVKPFYEEASVALVPEQAGGGFKLKIAEAAQFRLPIVAIKGSVSDHDMKPGIHFLEASSFEKLINLGIALLKDSQLSHRLVENMTVLFKEKYNIEDISNHLIEQL